MTDGCKELYCLVPRLNRRIHQLGTAAENVFCSILPTYLDVPQIERNLQFFRLQNFCPARDRVLHRIRSRQCRKSIEGSFFH